MIREKYVAPKIVQMACVGPAFFEMYTEMMYDYAMKLG